MSLPVLEIPSKVMVRNLDNSVIYRMYENMKENFRFALIPNENINVDYTAHFNTWCDIAFQVDRDKKHLFEHFPYDISLPTPSIIELMVKEEIEKRNYSNKTP